MAPRARPACRAGFALTLGLLAFGGTLSSAGSPDTLATSGEAAEPSSSFPNTARAPWRRDGMARRFAPFLERRQLLPDERVWQATDEIRIRFTTAALTPHGVQPADDANQDGRPDLVEAVLRGLLDARGLLVDQLQLAHPRSLDVVMVGLDGAPERGIATGAGSPAATILLDASPARGAAGARQAALQQYARLVARASGGNLGTGWGEALVAWTGIALDTAADESVVPLLAQRLSRLHDGLFVADSRVTAGNALWLAFVDAAHGRAAVRATLEELMRGTPPVEAIETALRRAAGQDLATAFREFHLWTLLVGERADTRYFPIARQLPSPEFASSADALPALAVQSDPALAPWGATQVRLGVAGQDGGLSVHFEGEFTADWQADLVLVDATQGLRRLPLALSEQGHGRIVVPIQGLQEVWLLVRRLGADDGVPRRYTYAAHHEHGFPFELVQLEARSVALEAGRSIEIAWETASEQDVVGFNVLRRREPGGTETAVNPLWIPAVGAQSGPVTYRFVDRTIEPGADYVYRVQGVTYDGLTSQSGPIAVYDLPRPYR